MQNLAPESRRDSTLETIESRALSPKETARTMLRTADQEVTGAKSGIESVRAELKAVQDPAVSEQLASLEADVDSAWDELNADIAEATAPRESGIFKKVEAPTDELEWEFPEEPERAEPLNTGELTEEEAQNVPELMRNAIDSALEGKGDAARIAMLMKTEDGKWEAEDRIGAMVREFTGAYSIAPSQLENLSKLAMQHTLIKELIVEGLRDKVGPKYAERLLSDPSYRKKIEGMHEAMSGTLNGPESPRLSAELSIQNLVVLQETIGERTGEMAKTLDLRKYGRGMDTQLEYRRSPSGKMESLIYVVDAKFDEQGELIDSQIDMSINYDIPGATESEAGKAKIVRSFNRKMKESPDGSTTPELTVKHELFELPDSVKGGGVAADITRASMEEYDKMGADAIALHANIDQGGYAWASYGYGWNHDEMNESQITDVISDAKNRILKAFEEASLPIDEKTQREIIDVLEEAEKHPLASTPQLLARIGKDGPFFHKGESGKWYSEEDYQKAIADGQETGELASMKGSLHAGKIGMLGNDWYGRIDLKANGPQGGKNRKLLEQKVAPKT